jgi:RNA polymerase sigma-70 factor (ECF subfamily)
MELSRLTAALADDLDGAFPRLVRALQDGVFAGVLRLTGSRSDAEEVTQEAFVRAYRALGGYSPDRIRDLHLREWVWTIALNLSRNRGRARRRHPEEPLEAWPATPDPAPGPEQEALAGAEWERLARHLARLPWPVRAAVVLRHVSGLSYAEVAATLGRPIGTVKSDVHRGLQRLRQSLEEEP